jgi:hypothetical protein
MKNGYTYGPITGNDYAMSFQMNNTDSRGFWWGDSAHTDAQGAMALSTNGKLTLAHSIRIGYGEADTTVPGATYRLDVSGSGNFTGTVTLAAGTTTSHAVRADRSISTGSGLSGGGNLTANRTLSVDSTVIRTTGDQTIAGRKTFNITSPITTTNNPTHLGPLFLTMSSGGTQGSGNFASGIAFGGINLSGNSARKAGIYAIQTGTNSSQVGIAFFSNNGTDSTGAVFERFRLASTGKLLSSGGSAFFGSVSSSGQSAIMESGSNANGQYIRFADGTQICWRSVTGIGPSSTGQGSLFRTGTQNPPSFPVAFSAVPKISGDASHPTATNIPGIFYSPRSYDTTTTTWPRFFIFTANSRSQTDFEVQLIAVGRWY